MLAFVHPAHNKVNPKKIFTIIDGIRTIRQLTPGQIGIPSNEILPSEYGYKMQGKNITSVLREMDPFKANELEDLMKPGNTLNADRLGKKESIRDLLADDNDFVLDKGLTHQQLGGFLLYFNNVTRWIREYKELTAKYGYPNAFIYNNDLFRYRREPYRGIETDPFTLDEETKIHNTVFNIDKGIGIKYTYLQALMIFRHGFYGGKETLKNKRIDPQRIIEVGGF